MDISLLEQSLTHKLKDNLSNYKIVQCLLRILTIAGQRFQRNKYIPLSIDINGMNKKVIIMLAVAVLIFFLFLIGSKIGIFSGDAPWWMIMLFVFLFCLVLLPANNLLLWHYLTRHIDSRLNYMDTLIERHIHECPAQKEHLLATCIPNDITQKNSDAFRRSFQAANPMFLLRLREQTPTITPSEEMLCMLIKMGLNNKETADRMSISQASLHTARYRLKRKLPLSEEERMDDWIRNLE